MELQEHILAITQQFIAMKVYPSLYFALAASQLAHVDVAYAKLRSSSGSGSINSVRRLLPEESIVDHVRLSESNTHFIVAAENEDGEAHPDILVRLSEDAVTEHTIISYDDGGSARRRGLSSRRVLVSAEADTFAAISIHTEDGTARGIYQQHGEASKDIVQEKGQRTRIAKSEELETPQWTCSLHDDDHSDGHRHLSEEEHEQHHHDHSHEEHNHGNHHHHDEFESAESAIESIRRSLRESSDRHSRKLLFGLAYNHQVDVYLDIDFDFVRNQGGGNEEGALDYVNTVWSAVNAIYEQEVGLHFNIKHIRITGEWETDATGTPYQSDWANNKIFEVEGRMLAKHMDDGPFWQEYDLYHAHLSRYQWGGHARQVGALCDAANSASVTTDLRGNVGKLDYLSFDLYITAHEVGHNAGSEHTHSTTQYKPIVDSCNELKCNRVEDNSGTIMSYCHLCQDTRKVCPTIGGKYTGEGDITDPGNWDNNPLLQGKISNDPKRVPQAMYLYVSALHDSTSCLSISGDPQITTVAATTATTTATTTAATSATTTTTTTTLTEVPPISTCNGDGICQPNNGENCMNCPDCAGVTNGNPRNRYCCGDGTGDTISCVDETRCTSSGWQCAFEEPI